MRSIQEKHRRVSKEFQAPRVRCGLKSVDNVCFSDTESTSPKHFGELNCQTRVFNLVVTAKTKPNILIRIIRLESDLVSAIFRNFFERRHALKQRRYVEFVATFENDLENLSRLRRYNCS